MVDKKILFLTCSFIASLVFLFSGCASNKINLEKKEKLVCADGYLYKIEPSKVEIYMENGKYKKCEYSEVY